MIPTANAKLSTRNAKLAYRLLRLLRFVVVLPIIRTYHQGLVPTVIWVIVRGRLFLAGMDVIRYARVQPALFVGGQIRNKGWAALRRAGVTSVVNMRSERCDRASGLPIPEDRYLHLPTVDDTPVALEDLKRGADWIAGQITAGGVVYVHCAAGSGRAPSLGAAYLIAHQGMSADEALAAIRKARPFIMPLAQQVARLREFEAWVRDGQA